MKDTKSTVVWNPRNIAYLEQMGILDGRTGRLRKTSKISISRFINECVTTILELGKPPLIPYLATTEELRLSWYKYQIAAKNTKIKELTEEIIIIDNLITKEREEKRKAEETKEKKENGNTNQEV